MVKSRKKILSFILVFALCLTAFGAMPMAASAAAPGVTTVEIDGQTASGGIVSTEVEVEGDIVIKFDEAITDKSGGTVKINDGTTDVPLLGGTWDPADKEYTVPYGPLVDDTAHSLIIAGYKGADGVMTETTVTFTTKQDVTPPTMTIDPADDATNVDIRGNIVITFDEPVAVSDDPFALKESAGNAHAVTAAGLDADDKVYTLNYAGLKFNTEYALSVDETKIEDKAKTPNQLAAFSDITFTTITTPPAIAVSTTVPTDGALDVPIEGELVITFDKEVKTEGTVKIGGTATSGALDATDKIYTVTYAALEYSKEYTVDVEGFTDTYDLVMTPASFTFKTEAAPPEPPVVAKVVSVTPLSDAPLTGTLTVKFDKDMSSDGTLLIGGKATTLNWTDSKTATAAYTGLENEKAYEVKLSGFKDVDGLVVDDYTVQLVTIKAPPLPDPTFTVSFNANGGAAVSATLTVKEGGEYGALPKTTRKGYTFSGWFTAKTGGTAVTATTKVATKANHTLYARWKANAYTVKLNVNKGEKLKSASKKVTFGSKIGTLPKPKRLGYKFLGWYTAKTGGKKMTANTVYATAAGDTFYARWNAVYDRGKAARKVAKVAILAKAAKNSKVLGYYKKGTAFIIIKRYKAKGVEYLQVKYKGKAAWVRKSQVTVYKIYPK